MKRRIIKALSFASALVMLLSVFLIPASAAVAPIINPMLDTYVVDDLVKMSYNPNHYPSDPSAEFLQVIHFLEYGYSPTDLRYYGLYLYLYNPSGKEIELNGSYLQLSYSCKDGSESKYLKYPLEVVSYSIDNDNEYVFYKLKVNGIGDIGKNITLGSRKYNLANLEILYKGEDKAVSKSWEKNAEGTRKNVWSYTGFQANFGSATEEGTLHYSVDELDTIPVEMHDASWVSDTSSLGKDYRWEVKSYYFNIPYSYIMKYGDPLNVQSETQGLYAVQGEYYKYGLNGLVVPDQEWYNKFEPMRDKHTGGSWFRNTPGFYALRESKSIGSGNYHTYLEFYNNFTFNMKVNTEIDVDNYTTKTYLSDKALYKFSLLSQGSSAHISNEALEALWKDFEKPILAGSSYLYMGSNTSGIGTRQEYEVKVNGNDLANSITTYASTKKDGIGKWLDKLFNKEMYTDEDGYMNCEPLIQINDLGEYTQESYIGNKLYLDYESYLELCDFYKEKRLDLSDGIVANNIYLMRLSVEPYYESEVTLIDNNGDSVLSSTGYYYEKVIHKDTDIFSFTFKNAKGALQTVPVDCDPVDNLGSVVPGDNRDDSNPNGYPDDPTPGEIIKEGVEDLWKFLQSLKGIVILAGSVIIIIGVTVLVVVFWKYLEPWFMRAGNLLGRVGRGLGGVLGFLFRGILTIFKAIWNIGFTVLFYFTGLDLRIKGGLDLGSGMTQKRNRYEKEDREWERERHRWAADEEQRKSDRHSWAGSDEVRKGVRFGWEDEEEQRKRDRHSWAGSDEVRKGVRLGWDANEEKRRQERHEAEMKEIERRSRSKSSPSGSVSNSDAKERQKLLNNLYKGTANDKFERDKNISGRTSKSYDTDEFWQKFEAQAYRDLEESKNKKE